MVVLAHGIGGCRSLVKTGKRKMLDFHACLVRNLCFIYFFKEESKKNYFSSMFLSFLFFSFFMHSVL